LCSCVKIDLWPIKQSETVESDNESSAEDGSSAGK
jgi:hypothetical protein